MMRHGLVLDLAGIVVIVTLVHPCGSASTVKVVARFPPIVAMLRIWPEAPLKIACATSAAARSMAETEIVSAGVSSSTLPRTG